MTPSKIRKILDDSSSKRLIPSEGLTIAQISYSLSKIGFGSVIYYSKDKEQEGIKRLLYSYVESRIPTILGIENKEGTFCNAIVCIGHIVKDFKSINLESDGEIKDVSSWEREFIVMDDNQPAYYQLDPESPGSIYKSKNKEPFNLRYILVPLHKNKYLEYRLANKLAKAYLFQNLRLFQDKEIIVFRLFLTSSRSF